MSQSLLKAHSEFGADLEYRALIENPISVPESSHSEDVPLSVSFMAVYRTRLFQMTTIHERLSRILQQLVLGSSAAFRVERHSDVDVPTVRSLHSWHTDTVAALPAMQRDAMDHVAVIDANGRIRFGMFFAQNPVNCDPRDLHWHLAD